MNYEWENKLKKGFFAGRKILIAGGTGFIGSRVVSFFEKHEIQVHVLTRKIHSDSKFVKYLQADLSDRDILKKYAIQVDFDYLIYLAANIPLAGEKKESYLDAENSTLKPFINFCSEFVCEGSKLIYVSSVDVLGRCDIYEYGEGVLPKSTTPYGLAKYCGELYAQNICEKIKAKCLIYRFAQVYGSKEPIVRIIPIIKKALLTGDKFEIWTDGEEKRRFLYVDDAVQAIFLGLLTDVTGIYNVAGAEVISIINLIKLMENVFNKTLNYQILHKVVGISNVPGIKKAENEIGFRPEVSMFEGVSVIRKEG